MTDNNHDERRQFSRIPFYAKVHLNDLQGELHLNCPVFDISLKGVLVAKPKQWHGELNSAYQIDLLLKETDIVIKIMSTVVHIDTYQIGFQYQQLELESMTHLKQLMMFNLGDPMLLERELSSLINPS